LTAPGWALGLVNVGVWGWPENFAETLNSAFADALTRPAGVVVLPRVGRLRGDEGGAQAGEPAQDRAQATEAESFFIMGSRLI